MNKKLDPHRRSCSLVARRRLQVRPRQAGQGRAQAEGRGHRLHPQKEFLVNLADGRFAKLTVALVLAHDDTSTAAAGGHEARHAARGLRRDGPGGASCATLITDDLTDANRPTSSIDARRPRGAQEGDPQGPQEEHRREGRGRPVLRPHRPVARLPHELKPSTTPPSRPPRPGRSSRALRSRSRPGARPPARRAGRAGGRDRAHADDDPRGAGARPGLDRDPQPARRRARRPAGQRQADRPRRGRRDRRGVRPAGHRGRARRSEARADAAGSRPERLASRADAGIRAVCTRRPSRRRLLARPTRTASPAWRRWSPTTCCCRSSRSR